MIEWSAGLYYGDTEIEGSTNRGFIIPLPPEFGGGFSPVTTTTDYILDEQKIRQQIQFNKSQPVKPPSRFQRRMQAMMEEAERQKKNKN